MILNTFNVQRKIKEFVGEFDDSIYIVDYSMNQVQLSINSVFDWEGLTEELIKAFPQADFEFNVIAQTLTINW